MLFQVNGLEITNLSKSSDGKTIDIDIIANHLTPDSEGELILKEAFDASTVKEFLDIGVVEFWHETKRPNLTKEEKMNNILGKPIAFRWENNKPVVTARCAKSNEIVQKMLPQLEANLGVYAASVGGRKVVLDVDDSTGQNHKIVPKIKWDHLAIAPQNSVINREPGLNVRLLKKANDIICEFDDMNVFKNNSSIISKEEDLKKALMAPSNANDLYSTSGGSVTKQSLEGSPVSKTLDFDEDESLMLLDTIIGIKNKKIPTDKEKYMKYFDNLKKKDFGDKSFRLINKFFKLKKRSVVT